MWSSLSCSLQVTAVIASVEDTLGVPSPEEMAWETEETDPETRRLAEGGFFHFFMLTYPLPLAWCSSLLNSAECKEHDVSPETPPLVTDEPHHQDDSSANEAEESPDPQQLTEQQDLNFGAVSGFLSGFAAAVQTTVSAEREAFAQEIFCAGTRAGDGRTGGTGESGEENDGGAV